MLYRFGMHNTIATFLFVSLAACAGRPVQPTTVAQSYACDDTVQLAHEGTHLDIRADKVADAAAPVQLGWVDDAGQHYVQWPVSTTQASSVEYIIPTDQRADAIARTYDTREGSSKVDWRLMSERACPAHAGYTAALTVFATGASMDDIKTQFKLTDKAEARALVHDAMIKLQRRYYGDR